MGLCFVAGLLLCWSLALGSNTSGVVTSLDPDRIVSWQQQWPSIPVELSYTNALEVNVIAMVRLNVRRSITQGVLEITFPLGFDVSTAYCLESNCVKQPTIQGQTVILLGINLTAGVDSMMTVGGIGNPGTPGGYGPFALRTRSCAKCQTLDINLSFAFVGISNSVGNMKTISLSIPSGTPQTRAAGLNIYFSFVISKDLWRHDTIRITVSEYWTLTNPVCVSTGWPNLSNKFVGANPGSPYSLQCSVTDKNKSPYGKQVIYIYGLGVDLDLTANDNNKYVGLTVTGFTAPLYDYPEDFYQWKVETMRCTTRDILERGNILSGPSVNPTVINTVSWGPVWTGSSILPGMQIFMNLNFTLPYEVPFGGYIQITTSATVNNYWGSENCYVGQLYRGADPKNPWVVKTANCTSTGAYSITVFNIPSLPAGSAFTIRSLVSFQTTQTSAQINSIVSYTPEGYAINAGYSLSPLTLNTKDLLLNTFNVLLASVSSTSSDNNLAGGTGDRSNYLKFQIAPNTVGLISTSAAVISCPLASALDDFRMFVPVGDLNTRFQVKTNTNLATATDFSSGTTTYVSGFSLKYTSPVQAALQDSILIPAGELVTTAGDSVVLGISRIAGTGLGWPRVATNPATFYECYITITDTSATTPNKVQRGVAQFSISPRPLTTKNFNYFCSRNYPGAPVFTQIQLSLFAVPASTVDATYYIEFDFNEYASTGGVYSPRFGSGLDDFSPYPFDVNDPITSFQQAPGSSLSFQIYSEAYHTKLRLSNFSSLSTSQSYALVFPIGEQLRAGVTAMKMRSYYTLTADDRVKYLHHEDNGTPVTTVAENSLTDATFTTFQWAFGNYVLNGDVVAKPIARLQIQTDTAAAQTGNWLYFVFPKGYRFLTSAATEGNWDIWSAVNPFVQQHYFSSPTPYFAFPTALFKCTNSACVDSLTSRYLEITGILPPLGVPCGYYDQIRAVVTTNSDLTGTCLDAQQLNHVLLLGVIQLSIFAPLSVQARGPNSLDLDVTFTFRTQHGGYQDSWIALTVQEEFTTIDGVTVCGVTGLPDYNSTTPVRCRVLGNAMTIDHFADFTTTPNVPITLTISHLLSPLRNWSSPSHFISSLISWTRDGRKIDTLQVTDADLISVTPAEPMGRSSIYKIQTIPMSAGESYVDLHLSFSLPHDIPAAAGRIVVTFPSPLNYPSGNIQDRCWTSGLKYVSCTAGGNSVVLAFVQKYIAGTIIDLYLDEAVNNLAQTQSTPTAFGIMSSWGPAVIDQDFQPDPNNFTNVQDASHKFKPLASLSEVIIPVSFEFDPTTACEESRYSFTFQLSARLVITDQLWFKFPYDDFDAFVGVALEDIESEPGVYYLPCSSRELGYVRCTADHWVVRVQPGLAVEKYRNITVTLNVINPPSGFGYSINLTHVNEEGEAIASYPGVAVAIPTAPAQNIAFRNVTSSSPNIREDAKCIFDFYLNQVMNVTDSLQVLFPPQYDLTSGSYSCSSTWLDKSAAATVTSPQFWNSASSCSASGTKLSMSPPAVPTAFDLSKRIQFNATVSIPQWGETRLGDLMWDFDASDFLTHPDYDVWTGLWELFVYDIQTKAYTSRSYPNLHCGYTGFFTPLIQLQTNSYDPRTDVNRVRLGSGLQSSDILITLPGPCASKVLTLTPVISVHTPDQGFLTITSQDDFVLYQTESLLRYRIAVDRRLTKGLYMLEWNIVETTQLGVYGNLYYPPVKTLIEVYEPSLNSIPITISTVGSVAVGARSVPVQVHLGSAPDTEVIVYISLYQQLSGVSIHPPVLTFFQGNDTAYYELIISPEFDLSKNSEVTVMFALGGVNAELYYVPEYLTVMVTGLSVTGSASLVDWRVGTCSRTVCQVQPQFASPGIFYWQLAAAGTFSYSLSHLLSKIDRLSDQVYIENEDAYIDVNQLNDFRVASQVDPKVGETWEAFQRRLYRAHLTTSYYGRAIQYTNSLNLTFDWLWAETDYVLYGFFVDQFQTASDLLSVSLKTAPMAEAVELVLTYSGTLSNSLIPQITDSLAELLGVNPSRLFVNGTAPSTASGQLTYQFVPDRFVEGQDPGLLLSSQGLNVGELNSLLAQANVTQVTIATIIFNPPIVRTWVALTQNLTKTMQASTLVTLSYHANRTALICCTALEPGSLSPSPLQTWLGLDAANEFVLSNCNKTYALNSTVSVGGLLPNKNYTLQCVLGDTYPLWPTLSPITGSQVTLVETNPLEPTVTQQDLNLPQGGGAVIVESINTAESLSGFLAIGLVVLFAH